MSKNLFLNWFPKRMVPNQWCSHILGLKISFQGMWEVLSQWQETNLHIYYSLVAFFFFFNGSGFVSVDKPLLMASYQVAFKVAKSEKPHTIAEKSYYWTFYTSKQYAITLNKLSLFFSWELYVILYDLYCLFSFKFFKSLIVADSLSVLLVMRTGNWKQHGFANNMFV